MIYDELANIIFEATNDMKKVIQMNVFIDEPFQLRVSKAACYTACRPMIYLSVLLENL